MKQILVSVIVLLLAALVCGCASIEAYAPPDKAGGDPVLLLKGTFGGKGNLVVGYQGMTIAMQQDGASEGLVSMFTGLISNAAGVFGGNPAPPEITVNVSSGGEEHDDSGVKHVVMEQQRE